MLQSVVLGWVLLYSIRKIFAYFSWTNRFENYLYKNGITLSLFHVVYETSRFNNMMFDWFNEPNRKRRALLSCWFDCGVVVMAFGQIASVIALSLALLIPLLRMLPGMEEKHADSGHPHQDGDPFITPIIPGINFPARYLLDFWICTFIVIVIHEFGHAAAASMERLQIQGCGTFFLFMFPGIIIFR